eukprot:61285-Chlamydomonas_euryale.AAC.1
MTCVADGPPPGVVAIPPSAACVGRYMYIYRHVFSSHSANCPPSGRRPTPSTPETTSNTRAIPEQYQSNFRDTGPIT